MINWNKYKEAGGSYQVDEWWVSKDNPLQVGDFIEGRLVQKIPKSEEHSAVYVLEQPDGKKIGVNGSAVLDTKFENIGVGSMVAVEYLGEVASKKRRGKNYKDFKVGFFSEGE